MRNQFQIEPFAGALSHIRTISADQITYHVHDRVGCGAFGTCYRGQYVHFIVCYKLPESSTDVITFKREALFLSHCSHPNLPWLFGTSYDTSGKKSLIISYHAYGNSSISFHKLLCAKGCSDGVIKKQLNWKSLC